MKIILSHPTSNEFNRAAALGFLKQGTLAEFHTTLASFPGDLIDSLGSFPLFSEIRRRRQDLMLKPLTQMRPGLEVGRQLAAKVGFNRLLKHETGLLSVDAVYRDLDRKVSSNLKKAIIKDINAIYGYEDGALLSFREAKKQHLKCMYDLPIGYWRSSRQLLKIEQEKWPEWKSTLIEFMDSEEKLAKKDEELKLADRIFVASTFTAQTLLQYPGKLAPVDVIPYGFPELGPKRDYSGSGKRPLKVLFVGGLSQRKGIANLFAAVNALGKKVDLTVIGRKVVNGCSALNEALSRHRWIPSIPHEDVLQIMRTQDVLVFPSLFEGFGMVITEAMSQGTPVITTDRTAGPDLIESGENGWLVEAGSTEALKAALEELLYRPELIAKAGWAAKETARLRPWEVYGQELSQAVISSINAPIMKDQV